MYWATTKYDAASHLVRNPAQGEGIQHKGGRIGHKGAMRERERVECLSFSAVVGWMSRQASTAWVDANCGNYRGKVSASLPEGWIWRY